MSQAIKNIGAKFLDVRLIDSTVVRRLCLDGFLEVIRRRQAKRLVFLYEIKYLNLEDYR